MDSLQHTLEEYCAEVVGLEAGGLQFSVINDMGDEVTGTVRRIADLDRAIINAYRAKQQAKRKQDFPGREMDLGYQATN